MPDTDIQSEPVVTEPVSQPATTGFELIPEELRKTSEISRFEKGGVPELAKSYVELSKSASGKVKIPDTKAPPEEWAKFNALLGMPEKPDGYKIEKKEGSPFDENFVGAMKPVFHKAGLRQEQLDIIRQGYEDYANAVIKQQQESIVKLNEARWEKYRKDWGENTTKENIELAKRAFNEVAPDELKEIMTVDDVIKDPILVAAYSKLWRKTMNDTFIKGEIPKEEVYTPRYSSSPEMYRNDKTPEGAKAREWFVKNKGFKY